MKKIYLKNRGISFKSLITTIVILSSIIYGCRKDFGNFGETQSDNVLAEHGVDLSMIQKSYNAQINNKLQTAAISQQDLSNLVGTLNVDWSTYTLYENPDSSQTIEFDMPDDNTLMTPEGVTVTDSAKFHAKTSAVFILRKDTVNFSFFMKTVEDRSAAGYLPVLSQVHYLHMPLGFTGNVMYFTLSRAFINGYTWDNGNITKTLTISPVASTQPQINATRPVKPTVLVEICTSTTYDVWYTRIMPDGKVEWDEIAWSFTVTSCMTVGDGTGSGTTPTGGVTGGGGGGSSTPPPPPRCPTGAAVASVKGKIIINVLEGGGTGGGTSTPCTVVVPPPPPILNNNLQNPCLKSVLNKLTQGSNLNGKIATIIHDVFQTNDKVNLTFEEYTNAGDGTAQTSIPTITNGIFNETIKLNLAQLGNSSQEFSATIMVHETLHAYLNYNSNLKTQLSQHIEMANKYVDDMRGVLQQVFPSLTNDDANAIILNGLGDIYQQKPSYWNQLLTKYNTDNVSIQVLADAFKKGIYGTKC
nr:hypothetical protein [uncultured Mucilaginibacter sp.]